MFQILPRKGPTMGSHNACWPATCTMVGSGIQLKKLAIVYMTICTFDHDDSYLLKRLLKCRHDHMIHKCMIT